MWRDDLRQCAQILRAVAESVPEKPYPGYIGNASHKVLWKAQDLELLANSGSLDEKVWVGFLHISQREDFARRNVPVKECPECRTVQGHASNCSRKEQGK